MPEFNLGRVRMVPRGAWDAATDYLALDVVAHAKALIDDLIAHGAIGA